MAIQKEFWLPSVQENLFKGIEIIKSVASDDSAYVQNKTVHIPNAGSAPNVTRANSTYPVLITERTDATVEYNLTNFEIGPVRLGWADALQLSYDKVSSITTDFMGNMNEALKNYMLSQWLGTSVEVVPTTGSAITTNWLGGSSTGSPKAIKGVDVRSAASILDKQKFPSSDRYLLLDYAMFWQLIGDVSYNDSRIGQVAGFPATIDNVYGFTVIQLPYVAAFNANADAVVHVPSTADGSFTFVAASRPVGLAFHKSAVGWAMTDVNMIIQNESPEHFGDIMSATVFAGGKYRRTANTGIVAVAARA